MRKFAIVSIALLATLLAFIPIAPAQQGAAGKTSNAPAAKSGLQVPLVTPGPGWKACPHCENEAYAAEDRKKANVDTHASNAHDISGVWNGSPKDLTVNGIPLNVAAAPSFTPRSEEHTSELQSHLNI